MEAVFPHNFETDAATAPVSRSMHHLRTSCSASTAQENDNSSPNSSYFSALMCDINPLETAIATPMLRYAALRALREGAAHSNSRRKSRRLFKPAIARSPAFTGKSRFVAQT